VRRLLGILLNMATAFSLLLCLAAVFFWIRSQQVADGLTHTHRIASDGVPLRRVVDVETKDGRLGIGVGYVSVPLFESRGIPNYPPPHIVWSHFGFRHRRLSYHAMKHILEMWYLEVPFWFLTLAFALPPIFGLTSYLRKRKRSRTACPTCGYDMRATPERCPECGTAAPISI